MGMDCYAHTYIGIKIDANKLFCTKKIKAYDHNYGEDFEFDPRTGKRLWKEVTVYSKEIFSDFEDNDEDDYCLDELSIEDYEIRSLSSSSEDRDAGYVVVMKDVSTTSHRSYNYQAKFYDLEPDKFAKEYKKFKAVMTKFGLWTDTFGLYNTLYISV